MEGGVLQAGTKLIKISGGWATALLSSRCRDSSKLNGGNGCRFAAPKPPSREGVKKKKIAVVSSSPRRRVKRMASATDAIESRSTTAMAGAAAAAVDWRRSGGGDFFAGCRRQCRCRDLSRPHSGAAAVASRSEAGSTHGRRGGGGGGGGGGSVGGRGRRGVAMAMLQGFVVMQWKTMKVGRVAGLGTSVSPRLREVERVGAGSGLLLQAGFFNASAWQSRGSKQEVEAVGYESTRDDGGEELSDFDVLESGWAPWEESLEPEGEYALRSLNGEEMSPEEVEAILKRRQVEFQERQEENDWENRALWGKPLVFYRRPPRDWPPEGWYVDPEKLAFMHGGTLPSEIVIDMKDRDEEALKEKWSRYFETEDDIVEQGEWSRWNTFMEDYQKWADANRERLDREALQLDPKYYHGRRRTGELYWPGMFELPFVDVGQHWWGVVTAIHLYEGAFVNFGCTHDAWIPIRDNDWYEVRKHVYVGMHCHVEVLVAIYGAQERTTFQKFLHVLIFRKFEYPPIMTREDEATLEEIARESNRPFWPKPRMRNVPEEVEYRQHPDVVRTFKVWRMAHMACEIEEEEAEKEQLRQAGILTTEDDNDDDDEDDDEQFGAMGIDFRQATSAEDEDDDDDDAEDGGVDWDFNDPDYEELFPMDPREEQELDIESARQERAEFDAAMEEADAKGIEFVPPRPYYEARIAELERMQWQRHMEHERTTIRDNMRRVEEGLPIEEPTRYVDRSWFGENNFDPDDKRFSHSYFGDPEQIEREEMEGGPRKEPPPEKPVAGGGDGEDASASAEAGEEDEDKAEVATGSEQEDEDTADDQDEAGDEDSGNMWVGSSSQGNGQDRDAVNGLSRGKLSFRDMFGSGDSTGSEGALRGVLPQLDEDDDDSRGPTGGLSSQVSAFESDKEETADDNDGEENADDGEEEEEK
ncbi:hypothetical protein CBR_g31403 [Chara braunii]|uniref:S1 motif domain-containing protein n=1 Tax=Chara braunii TaxID=69332 RepID=A0A388LEW8_CHABU|nr:hypothetical protein CBR_g31403 [Chara braunii]|eukprot:GBG80848.1 hypothetical protein CBR_g31403 [Chara braunii]